MSIRRSLAAWLCPKMARNEERYFRLHNQASTVHRWLNGEAADVAQWLMETDADHWRSIDAKAIGELPPDIQKFREYLHSRRTKAA